MASIREIADTLRKIAAPGMKPKAIRSAIRERHPEASKKEIVRAAFHAVTEAPATAEGATAELHDFALAERIAEDNADVVLKVSKRKRKKRSSAASERSQAH
ncbi:hypothetical protein LOK46_32010 (plasmid) [Methylobacterium sp. NMS14P]|uniref:hypothetical protein n=1 Tax=Methylobacterium sp. NMS14P TaxID=2894310 RepID=UPI002359EDE4|nr:hypothetical protein [Methylobacterium sp. NMS14P]WCS28540.1 hypothetical protein LOK46_32010 [Methylobacterium sp. NMS14P]